MNETYRTIHNNRINGNLSEYKKQVKELTNIELLQLATYISDKTELSAFQIIEHLTAVLKSE